MSLPLDKIKVILKTFYDDEWYDHLVQWRLGSRRRKVVITNPWEFYFPSSAVTYEGKVMESGEGQSPSHSYRDTSQTH